MENTLNTTTALHPVQTAASRIVPGTASTVLPVDRVRVAMRGRTSGAAFAGATSIDAFPGTSAWGPPT